MSLLTLRDCLLIPLMHGLCPSPALRVPPLSFRPMSQHPAIAFSTLVYHSLFMAVFAQAILQFFLVL